MSVNANEALTLPVALLNPHFIQADLRQHTDFIRQKKRGSYMASKTLKDKKSKFLTAMNEGSALTQVTAF